MNTHPQKSTSRAGENRQKTVLDLHRDPQSELVEDSSERVCSGCHLPVGGKKGGLAITNGCDFVSHYHPQLQYPDHRPEGMDSSTLIVINAKAAAPVSGWKKTSSRT